MDTIHKRRQGTKVCKDVLEKSLSIEKKAVVRKILCISASWYTSVANER